MCLNTVSPFNLDVVSKNLGGWLDKHPTANKVVIVAFHFFRASMMTACVSAMPFSMPVNMGLGLTLNLGYRLAIERRCPYKFALLSSLGGACLRYSMTGLMSVAQQSAFQSIDALKNTLVNLVPFFGYTAVMVYQVNSEVKPCGCRNKN